MLHKLHVLRMNDDLWDRVGILIYFKMKIIIIKTGSLTLVS